MILGYVIPITPREMPFKLDVLEAESRPILPRLRRRKTASLERGKKS